MFDLVLLIVFSIFVLLQDRRGVCAPRAGDSCRSSAAGALDGVSQTTVYDTCWQGPRLDGGRLSVAGPAARRAAGRCRRRRPRLPRLRVRRPRRPPGTRQLRARAPERAFTTPADRRQRSLGSAGCSAAAAGVLGQHAQERVRGRRPLHRAPGPGDPPLVVVEGEGPARERDGRRPPAPDRPDRRRERGRRTGLDDVVVGAGLERPREGLVAPAAPGPPPRDVSATAQTGGGARPRPSAGRIVARGAYR